jgi:hypothetical protein
VTVDETGKNVTAGERGARFGLTQGKEQARIVKSLLYCVRGILSFFLS